MDFIKSQEEKIKEVLNKIGYKVDYVKLNVSNMPELGDYQFNGVMPLAKEYHKNPRENPLYPIYCGRLMNTFVTYSTMMRSIQGPKIRMATKTAITAIANTQ